MRRKGMIVILLLRAVVSNIFAQNEAIPNRLHMIDSLFSAGSYQSAELEARRLFEYRELPDSVRVEVHKYIAFALIAQGKSEPAKEHFESMLEILPDYTLDPILTSPKILIVFNEVKQFYRLSKQPAKDTATPPSIVKHPSITYRAVLFPGWEQLYAGRVTPGAIFLGTGIAALATGLTLEFLRSTARKDYLSETDPRSIDKKYNLYNKYYKTEIASFIAFAIVYIASEIEIFTFHHDSLISFQSQIGPSAEQTVIISLKF